MPATTARTKRTTTQKGLGHRHQVAVAALKRKHQDGSPCDWCKRPMWLDRRKNYDYNPERTNPGNGVLQGDHSGMSRREALRLGLTPPPPDRLLHGECNRQRGDGHNDHLAAVSATAVQPAAHASGVDTSKLAMPWPW